MKKLIMFLLLISCVLVFPINVSARVLDDDNRTIQFYVSDYEYNGAQYYSVNPYIRYVVGYDTVGVVCRDSFFDHESGKWFCGDDELMTLLGNAGLSADEIIGGSVGDDQLFGHDGADVLLGKEGDDYLFGNEGDDCLFGNEGDDKLSGGAGNDMLSGGPGDDSYKIYIHYTSNHDTIQSDIQGNDTVVIQDLDTWASTILGNDLKIVFDGKNTVLIKDYENIESIISD